MSEITAAIIIALVCGPGAVCFLWFIMPLIDKLRRKGVKK